MSAASVRLLRAVVIAAAAAASLFYRWVCVTAATALEVRAIPRRSLLVTGRRLVVRWLRVVAAAAAATACLPASCIITVKVSFQHLFPSRGPAVAAAAACVTGSPAYCAAYRPRAPRCVGFYHLAVGQGCPSQANPRVASLFRHQLPRHRAGLGCRVLAMIGGLSSSDLLPYRALARLLLHAGSVGSAAGCAIRIALLVSGGVVPGVLVSWLSAGHYHWWSRPDPRFLLRFTWVGSGQSWWLDDRLRFGRPP